MVKIGTKLGKMIEKIRWLFTDRIYLCQKCTSNVSSSFEQCLKEEFLVNTQNYPKEYHDLFRTKFQRAEENFKAMSKIKDKDTIENPTLNITDISCRTIPEILEQNITDISYRTIPEILEQIQFCRSEVKRYGQLCKDHPNDCDFQSRMYGYGSQIFALEWVLLFKSRKN